MGCAPSSATPISLAGNGAVSIAGTVYAPRAKLNLTGNGGLNAPATVGGLNEYILYDLNVTGNHRLIDEAAKVFRDQDLDGSVVLTSSANSVVAKRGSEAYDVSKAALNHLVRELAVSLAPKVRVNGINPATVVKGSTMFPRDRVIASLKKYSIPFSAEASDEDLRTLLAEFYAQRTLTHTPIEPGDCARAILFLAGPQSKCTTGHLIPVDGGLTDAFLR